MSPSAACMRPASRRPWTEWPLSRGLSGLSWPPFNSNRPRGRTHPGPPFFCRGLAPIWTAGTGDAFDPWGLHPEREASATGTAWNSHRSFQAQLGSAVAAGGDAATFPSANRPLSWPPPIVESRKPPLRSRSLPRLAPASGPPSVRFRSPQAPDRFPPSPRLAGIRAPRHPASRSTPRLGSPTARTRGLSIAPAPLRPGRRAPCPLRSRPRFRFAFRVRNSRERGSSSPSTQHPPQGNAPQFL